MTTPANLFQASSQVVKPVTALLVCLLEDLLASRGLFFMVSLLNDTYSPLTILAAYLVGTGGQQGTDSLFNLAFAREDRRLVCFLRVCLLRYLWPDSELELSSGLEEDVSSVDELELLLLESRRFCCLRCLRFTRRGRRRLLIHRVRRVLLPMSSAALLRLDWSSSLEELSFELSEEPDCELALEVLLLALRSDRECR